MAALVVPQPEQALTEQPQQGFATTQHRSDQRLERGLILPGVSGVSRLEAEVAADEERNDQRQTNC